MRKKKERKKSFENKMILLCFLLLCCFLDPIAFGDPSNELRIHDPYEFIAFFKSPSNYSGTTVYLESDLDFSGGLSEQFEPFGLTHNIPFSGTFDGQGYAIRNLVVRSSLELVGLFGVSSGIIKNVVMDPTCSIACNFTGNKNVRLGGIIGTYNVNYPNHPVANVVTMANVAFEGNTTGNKGILYMGGIVGAISPSTEYDTVVKNCVNYGSLINYGVTSGDSTIGGVLGGVYAVPFIKTSYILNCFNYGPITITGTSKYFFVGGVIGNNRYISLSNCVSAGAISSDSGYKGGIVGEIFSNRNITHCLWTDDVGCGKASGRGSLTPIMESSLVSINATIIDELNEYASENGWNKWLLNEDNKSITFKMNGNDRGLNISSQLVLLPDLATGWRDFAGWFIDEEYETPFSSLEIVDDTTLYGLWNKYIVSFDLNGGDSISFTTKVTPLTNTYGDFPEAKKAGYSLIGWFTEIYGEEKKEMDSRVASDHTLYAQWTPKNYTITFDFANGTKALRVYRFNESIEYPENMIRNGYTFVEWNPSPEVMPTDNLTATAQWKEITANVEIVFWRKDLTEEMVEDIIRYYTDEVFMIVEFEEKGEEIRVIIKFIDKEKAGKFIRSVNENKRKEDEIKSIGPTEYDSLSFVDPTYPKVLLIPLSAL